MFRIFTPRGEIKIIGSLVLNEFRDFFFKPDFAILCGMEIFEDLQSILEFRINERAWDLYPPPLRVVTR